MSHEVSQIAAGMLNQHVFEVKQRVFIKNRGYLWTIKGGIQIVAPTKRN